MADLVVSNITSTFERVLGKDANTEQLGNHHFHIRCNSQEALEICHTYNFQQDSYLRLDSLSSSEPSCNEHMLSFTDSNYE